MKILVIDDNQKNLETAVDQLGKEHELVTVSSYEEAEGYLASNLSHVYACDRWDNVKWDKDNKAIKQSFDVILTDLFMPANKRGISSNYNGADEIPYGLVIAMTARRLGIPVAIVTNANHHSHPLLWAMDMLRTDKLNEEKWRFEFREEFCLGDDKQWGWALEALVQGKNQTEGAEE
jgi:CheY-like chemotaxis protein